MSTLYDISQRYINLQELLDGEENDCILIQNALGNVEDELNDKMLNIAKIIRNLKGYVSMVEEEEKRLKNKKTILKNQINFLNDYIKTNLTSLNIKKLDLGVFKLSLRKSESVEILDLNAISKEYLKFKDPEPNKIEIKKAIKNGTVVNGARLIENESLVIK